MAEKKSKAGLWLGLVLLMFSGPPLLEQIVEASLNWYDGFHYTYEWVDGRELSFGGHHVQLTDGSGAEAPVATPGGTLVLPVRIRIDGNDFSSTANLEIHPKEQALISLRRYHSWVSVARVTDRTQNTSFLAIAQRMTPFIQKEGLQWRLLLLHPDGRVQEEIFSYDERTHPTYRARLAGRTSPTPLGYHSEVFWSLPSLGYPVLYPWASGGAGIVLTWIGMKSLRRPKQG